MTTEAEEWIVKQRKNSKGKVDITTIIAEGQRRGYCICSKPIRQLISFNGLTCVWCLMPETIQSYNFWYKHLYTEFSSLNDDLII